MRKRIFIVVQKQVFMPGGLEILTMMHHPRPEDFEVKEGALVFAVDLNIPQEWAGDDVDFSAL